MNTLKAIKKMIPVAIMVVALFGLPIVSMAQDPGCPSDCPGALDCPPQCVPIDGGLSLLIAAGIGLGAKKAYDRKKALARKLD